MLHLPLQLDQASATEAADSLIKAGHQRTEAVVEGLKSDPQTTLQTLGQDALNFGLKLLLAIVIYIVGAWLIKKIKSVITRSMERKGTDKAVVTFTSSLVTITLTVLLIILVIQTLGINTTSLAALLAAGGMALGMALSGTVQNFAGGIMLIIFKPFKAGDYIEALGYEGTVSEVSIVSTKIVTTDNRVIVLPNGSLSAGTVNNFSQRKVRRQDFNYQLTLDTDLDAAISTMKKIVDADSRIIKKADGEADAPSYIVSDVSKDGVTLTARIWSATGDYWPLYYDMRKAIYEALREDGIRFSATRLDLNNHSQH